MSWNLPPGVTDRMIDEQANGYGEPEAEGPDELDMAYELIHRLRSVLKLALPYMESCAEPGTPAQDVLDEINRLLGEGQ